MSNIYKLPTILISTFLILCFVNIKDSSSKILDIKTPAKQVIIYDHEVDEVLFEKFCKSIWDPSPDEIEWASKLSEIEML